MDPTIVQALASGNVDEEELNQILMLALGGGALGNSGRTGQPYKAPNVTTGMDSAVANLSVEASRNPFAIGHLMNAQAQSRDSAKTSMAMAQHFGNLNAKNALMQRAMANQGSQITTMLKNLQSFDPPMQQAILAAAQRAHNMGIEMPQEYVDMFNAKERSGFIKETADAQHTGQQGGIDLSQAINGMYEQLGMPVPKAVTPLSVRTANISGANKDAPEITIDGNFLTKNADGLTVPTKVRGKGTNRKAVEDLMGINGAVPFDLEDPSMTPQERARLKMELDSIEQEDY